MEVNKLVINWFDDLGESREDLPYELTKVFFHNESSELKESVNHSLEHINRILKYEKILDDTFEDGVEQFWYDLVARLDDTSYYICMVMPFLREMLEPSTEYLFTNKTTIFEDYSIEEKDIVLPDIIKNLHESESKFASKAWLLGYKFSYAHKKYLALKDIDDFIFWNKQFLGFCAQLLILVSEISLSKK